MLLLHLEAPPIPPSQRTEMPVPPELEALVLACLVKDHRHRPHDASVVLDRLLRCRSGEAWDNESARTWWEHHLADVAGVAAAAPVGGFEPALV